MMLTIGRALTGMFLFLLAYNLRLQPPRLDEAHFMNKSIPILPFYSSSRDDSTCH